MPTISPTAITYVQALRKYQDLFMASRNLAERTRREYSNDLKGFFAFLGDPLHIHTLDGIRREHLEAYLALLDRRGFTGNTRRRKVATLRSFFLFAEEASLLTANPARKLVPPEREHLQPRVLTEGEYKRLQLAVAHEPRDAAVIEVLLQTGVRLSELAALKVPDIELPLKITKDEGNIGSIRVMGKGRKERTVTLNWKGCKAVKAYLRVRPETDDPRLFITKFGEPAGPRAIQHVVHKYLSQAGIPHASVHTLRHTLPPIW